MKFLIAFLLLTNGILGQVLVVSLVADVKPATQPALAPKDCPCRPECKCDPCECLPPTKPAVSVRKKYTPAEASVVVRATKGKETFQCSGTAICDHTVLTCAHVIRDGFDLSVNGKPAKLLRMDRKGDVAVLAVDDQLKPASVATTAPKLREAVTAYGYEHDKRGQLWYFPSHITRLDRYLGFSNQSIAGRPQSGRSGGGLFNSAGELIGVCSAADGQEGLYAGLPAVRKLVYGDPKPIEFDGIKKLDASKYVAPDFSVQKPSNNLKDCPDGKCPLIKKAPAPKAANEVRGVPAISPATNGGCANGQCGRPAVRIFRRGR